VFVRKISRENGRYRYLKSIDRLYDRYLSDPERFEIQESKKEGYDRGKPQKDPVGHERRQNTLYYKREEDDRAEPGYIKKRYPVAKPPGTPLNQKIAESP
jgi:hypothetical protein